MRTVWQPWVQVKKQEKLKKKEAERSNDEFSQLKMSSVKLKKHPVTACISDTGGDTLGIFT